MSWQTAVAPVVDAIREKLVFITLVSIIIVTVLQTLPPSPLPANAPAAEFSAERAMKHILVIAARPRLTGTPAYEAAMNYVLAELADMDLETEIQRAGALQNIIGWIEGTRSSGIVLLTAHLDSVAENVGASDDGSGVAVLLETGRALMSGTPLKNTIAFLFTDHEEGGFYGAKAFIDRHPWAKEVKVVIGFDASGPGGPGVLSTTSADNGWLIRQLAQADPYFVGSSAITALAYSSKDFGRGFKPTGFSGYEFDLYWDRFDSNWVSRIYGTPVDTLDHVSLPAIQHQGYHALSLARHLGNLNKLDDPKEPDAVYFSVLRWFVIAYPETWAVPFAIAVAGAFFGVLAIGLKHKTLIWRGMSYGALVSLAGIFIAPVPNVLLEKWLPGGPPDYARPALDQKIVVIAVVLSSLTLILLCHLLAQKIRSTSLPDITMGALMPLTGGMVGTSIAIPALSFALIWPLLLSLLACANWFYAYIRKNKPIPAIAGLLFSGAANTIILGPSILLGLFDQLSLTLLLLGALCGFLVPQIHLILRQARIDFIDT